ncbi:hypothetical protein H3N56_13145 [Cetobacterium sp. 2A]|uniref:hypothetical protein n=1 Tax=unclassified Cetobacterium TaxID=2630983 RepID=UPI00163C6F86|nr:hypothetical protein [Cetobacterium sp. 2A]MBC2857381.1 hypothetical protein [Cetobacterium sp. 2A]
MIDQTKTIVLKVLNFFKNSTVNGIKQYDYFSKKKIRFIAFLLSIGISGLQIYETDLVIQSKEFIWSLIVMTISLYCVLDPFLYYFRLKFINFFKKYPLYAIGILFYFSFLVSILQVLGEAVLSRSMDNFIVKLLHIIIIVISIIVIIMIIMQQFITVIFNKREVKQIDILMIFLTYFAVGFAYSSLFHIFDIISSEKLFNGLKKMEEFDFEIYLNYIYISFGALTTVGSGTITAANIWIRLMTVQETMLGIFITSFSLTFIFSVLGSGNLTPPNGTDDKKEGESIIYSEHFFITFFKKLRENLKELENYGK